MMSLLVPGESGIEYVEVDGFHGFSVLFLCQLRADGCLAGFSHHAFSGFFNCSRIGNWRMRLPVAAKIALHKAGAIVGVAGSPTPPNGTSSACGTMCT